MKGHEPPPYETSGTLSHMFDLPFHPALFTRDQHRNGDESIKDALALAFPGDRSVASGKRHRDPFHTYIILISSWHGLG